MKISWATKRFEELTVLELHDLLKLRVDVFVVEQTCAYQEIDGEDTNAIHLFTRDEKGEMVAYSRILPAHGDGLPHVGRVVIHPDARGKGMATRAMEEALVILQDLFGTRRSALAAQAHLEQFYARFGYVRTGADYIWDGIPHVDMERKED